MKPHMKPRIPIRSPALAAVLLTSLLTVACGDLDPSGPDNRPDVHAADSWRPTASAEWSEQARSLVSARQSNPFQAVRNFAILHLAQHNAVVAADAESNGGRQLSRRAAVAAASAVALSYVYPQDAAQLERRVQEQVATPGWLEAGSPDVQAGLAVGRAVGAAVVEHAKTDRLFDPWTGTVPTGPGRWSSSATPPAPPGGAGFGAARTFFLTSASQFRPPPPPAFGSPAFQAAVAEVRQISDTRTTVQDSLARFWALPGGTFTPAGYWEREAAQLATARRFGERRAAHLLALQGVAVFDALIACNDAKYAYWLLRPSQADPAITLPIGLPNFPAYPSNHACLSAAGAHVIGERIPSERARLHALAEQAALSRVFGGIHYRFDGDVGLDIGRKVAAHAIASDPGERAPFPLR